MPPPLRFGSRVAVVAPSSGFDRQELLRGLAWLGSRYRLRLDERIFAREGYLAGSDETRSAALSRALLDPEVDGIVVARGGYGAMRILDDLPWDAVVARPKRLVGFSDVTALHVALASRGIGSVHGPNVTGLGRSITPAERASFIAALEDGALAPWTELEVFVDGEAEGVTFGGNLALVHAMAAAGRVSVPERCILFLEDVTERPYRVDRMLTSLLLGGHLARAAAIVFGRFLHCDAGADGVTVEAVLRDRTRELGIPVVMQAPFGHGAPNHAFPVCGRARLRGGVLEW